MSAFFYSFRTWKGAGLDRAQFSATFFTALMLTFSLANFFTRSAWITAQFFTFAVHTSVFARFSARLAGFPARYWAFMIAH